MTSTPKTSARAVIVLTCLAIALAVPAAVAPATSTDDGPVTGPVAPPSYLDYLPEALQRVHEDLSVGRFEPHLSRLEAVVDSLRRADALDTPFGLDRLDLLVLGRLKAGLSMESTTREYAARVLARRLETVGPDDPRTAMAHYNLGAALVMTGEATRGATHLRRCLAIRQALADPPPQALGIAWYGLGNAYAMLGMKSAALRAYENAVRSFESGPAPESIHTVMARWTVAIVQGQLGDVEPSAAGMARVHDRILRMDVAPLWNAQATDDYALALFLTGRTDEVLDLLDAGLRYHRDLEGVDPLNISLNHALRAVLLLRDGRNEAAREHLRTASELSTSVARPDWMVATHALTEVAGALLAGDLTAATEGLGRIELADVGDASEAPSIVQAWAEQVRSVHAYLGQDFDEAVDLALDAARIVRRDAATQALLLRDFEAFRSGANRMTALSVAITALVDHPESLAQDRVLDVWNAIADTRTLTTRVLRARRRSLAEHADPEVSALSDVATALRVRLARAALEDDPADDATLADLRSELEEIERLALVRGVGLTDASPAPADDVQIESGFQSAVEELESDHALVSIVRYEHVVTPDQHPADDPTASLPTRITGSEYGLVIDPSWVRPSYAAFVREAGTDRLRVVPLGDAATVDAAVAAWRAWASSPEGAGDAGRVLRARIWDPVAPFVEDAGVVLVVPDGELLLIDLDTLQQDDGRFLAETAPLLHYLPSEATLAHFANPLPPDPEPSILIVAGPTFSASLAELMDRSEPRHRGLSDVHPARATRGRSFTSLPDARREGEELARLWSDRLGSRGSVRLLTGEAALERDVVRLAPEHSVLHFATHAFALSRATVPSTRRTPSSFGIALANASEASGPVPDDGLLFAEEFAGLDLHRTRWVVLSACESGLGEVRPGEGVHGLRDAVEAAGARTSIVSLWKVDDAATRHWMLALYGARLDGASTPEAVRAANLQVLQRRRDTGASVHPFYWGAFVANGDWR